MSDYSEIEEMYLKRIFEVHVDTPDVIVKTTQLANLMDVTPASATEMIHRLTNRGMVTHVPYKGCRLSPLGFQYAARIKRREGLLQILLSDVIGFSGDVSAVACRMEHVIGDDLEAALDRLLGYPENAPDGTRIPAVERAVEPLGKGTLLPISALPEGTTATVDLILVSGVEGITIGAAGVMVGSTITNSGGVLTCDGSELELSGPMSMRILVRLTSDVVG
jgi:DtxR family Mn-dependent transcriptional regulator